VSVIIGGFETHHGFHKYLIVLLTPHEGATHEEARTEMYSCNLVMVQLLGHFPMTTEEWTRLINLFLNILVMWMS